MDVYLSLSKARDQRQTHLPRNKVFTDHVPFSVDDHEAALWDSRPSLPIAGSPTLVDSHSVGRFHPKLSLLGTVEFRRKRDARF